MFSARSFSVLLVDQVLKRAMKDLHVVEKGELLMTFANAESSVMPQLGSTVTEAERADMYVNVRWGKPD